MIIKSDLDMCRAKLQGLVGRRVRLTSSGGRKRIIVHEGVIESCYPNVFTVKCGRTRNGDEELVSYSYVDVLTKTVTLCVGVDSRIEAAS